MIELSAAGARVTGLAWARRIGELVEDLRRREDRLALVLSLVIGALVGLVVVAFVLLTGRLASQMYPAGGAGWRRILVPTMGSLFTGILLFRFFPDARGSGIPQTRAAIFIHDGRISLRTVIGKFVCCATSLASGIALGREGPSVHIGSGIASVIGRRLGLSTAQVRWLVPVGAAAALSAAFNTPIAAVLFSLEEIMGDMHAPILGSVVLSSVTSWMVLHLVLGDEPLFHVGAYHLVSAWELLVYGALGVVGGLGSVAFVKLLLALRRRFYGLPRWSLWAQPVVGGLTVGLLGYVVPQILGVGYDQVDRVLGGEVVLKFVVLLALLKMIATAVCYASGNAGGIFGPSMFIGAMLGAAVGRVVRQCAGTDCDPLFCTNRGTQLSRDALEGVVRRHTLSASRSCPSLAGKRVSPHVLRHSTAMELLHHGVDQSVIALWLGHESVETTQVYMHADLRLKEKALARMTAPASNPGRYRPDDKLLAFLQAL